MGLINAILIIGLGSASIGFLRLWLLRSDGSVQEDD